MIIIGEKINGSIPSVAEAIANRDAEFIKQRALAQANSGASYIDCCASVPEAEEVETLKWMIDCIQEVTDLPISVDSPSADVLTEAYKFCRKPGIFNSVSGEGDKIDKIFPLMAQPENKGWQVIALLSDDTGIPKSAEDRLKVFDKIMAKAKEYGISPDRIHIDPLVEMLCTSEDGIAMNVEVISSVRKQYPMIHITAAISNISFNLPVRKLINFGFVVLAMNAGLDSAIMDPTNRDMLGLVYATEALLGLDDFRKDAFATGYHAWLLQRKYPHAEIAFSCPRLRPIINNDRINPMDVHERQLLQVVCAYRLFMPFASITVSTRECERVRDNLVNIAATKISAGVSTGIGSHVDDIEDKGDDQFEISDGRSVDEVFNALKDHGLQPVMNDYIYL